MGLLKRTKQGSGQIPPGKIPIFQVPSGEQPHFAMENGNF